LEAFKASLIPFIFAAIFSKIKSCARKHKNQQKCREKNTFSAIAITLAPAKRLQCYFLLHYSSFKCGTTFIINSSSSSIQQEIYEY
jgi:hypothetical protein